jgi:hypothetical protein
MDRFLIQVDHEAEPTACVLAIQLLFSTGSHYLTQADFGCKDGVHTGWIIVEGDSKEEVRNILPPVYRAGARIVKLNKFSPEELDELLKSHKG